MRKAGGLSLVVYIILTLVFGFMSLTSYYRAQAPEASENLESLGHALVMVIFLVFTIAMAIATVVKFIHFGTGWGFFGFICILFDIFAIFFFGSSIYDVIVGGGEATVGAIAFVVATIGGFVASLISNIKSLAR